MSSEAWFLTELGGGFIWLPKNNANADVITFDIEKG